ncbi:MAG: TauD/TfdA family dioxygenase [Pseudomonadota bacterium]|nr:TauD/TfdA family dioxygenase [Pseudomonadota bacterium]
MMRLRPIAGAPFGVGISGIDLATGMSDDLMRDLAETLYIHRVLVIRDQALDKAQYMRFGRAFGTPIAHVLDHLRDAEFPGMMEVGNVRESQKDPNVRNGAAFWHTDQSYEAAPANLTMLYCIHAPARGGETLVADQRGAADALPAELRAKVEGRSALHFYGAASGRDGEQVAARLRDAMQQAKVPPVRHPILRPHPVTGTRSLYAMAGTPLGIDGYGPEEGAALLTELKRHATAPERIYRHVHVPGSILIYDTNQTLHSGTPVEFATGDADRRLLWRISIRDLPGALTTRFAA